MGKRLSTKSVSLKEPEALGLLGLARRAGAVSLGVAETRRLLESGRLRAVVFAGDASETQLVKVSGLALGRGIPTRRLSTKDRIGRALGIGPVSVVGVKVGTFAEQLLRESGPEVDRSKGAEGGTTEEKENRK